MTVSAEGRRAASATFGKYELFAKLGSGGMAEVFLALSRGMAGFNKLVVLKRLRPNVAEEVSMISMFLDEARLAARLHHPNIVNTYEVGEHEGSYFIAMEYLEGQPLNKILKNPRIQELVTPAMWCHVFAQALAGLHHAHEQTDFDGKPLDIVHRDLSPHNIFLTYAGETKLVDFGIAKAAFRLLETETVSLRGKLAYMAPEQLNRRAVDHRADIWAAGVVLWEVLTGARLFKCEDAESTLAAVLTEPIPPVRDRRPDIPVSVDGVVARALTRDVHQRWPSAGAMADALEAAAPPASARELGAWTEGVARESLDALRAALRVMEATELKATEGGSGRSLSAPAFSADDTRTEGVPAGPTLEPRTKRRSWAWWVLPAAAVVAVSVTSAVLLRGRFGAGSGATLEPVGSAPSLSSSLSSSLSLSPSSTSTSSDLSPSSTSSSAPSAASEPHPQSAVAIEPAPAGVPSTAVASRPTPPNLVRRPTTRPAPSAHPSKAPPTAPPVEPPAAVVTPPPPLCAVPYMVDARGIRKLKPECMR